MTTQGPCDGLETLSTACYTIPCQPRKKARKAATSKSDLHQSPFPVLEQYEQDQTPSRLRYRGYQHAIAALDVLFEGCVQSAYKSLFDDLSNFISPSQSQAAAWQETAAITTIISEPELFIPGFDEHKSTSAKLSPKRAIRTAFLISSSAPSLSSFSDRLVSHISASDSASSQAFSNIIVILGPGECTNLNASIRLLVARFISESATSVPEAASQLERQEEAALAVNSEAEFQALKDWYIKRYSSTTTKPKLVLHLPALEAIDPVVLSDLLLSLQAFSNELDSSILSHLAPEASAAEGSTLLLLLGITSPSGTAAKSTATGATLAAAPSPWADLIPCQALQAMDFSRFSLPSKESVWLDVVQSLLISRKLPISLGRKTFEYVRQAYWEAEADLDSVRDIIRLAMFLHFTSKPESAFVGLENGDDTSALTSSWKPEFLTMLRLALVEFRSSQDEGMEGAWLPHRLALESDEAASENVEGPHQYLSQLLESDSFLLRQVSRLKAHRDVLASRQEIIIKFLARGFQCLHKLDAAASSAIPGRSNPASANMSTNGFALQKELELTAAMMTLVVGQCLQASTGFVDTEEEVTGALSLSAGLSKLGTAARRLQSTEFEALLDDFVLFTEEEVAALEAEQGDALFDLDDTEFAASRPARLETASTFVLREMQLFLSSIRTFQQRLAQNISSGGADLKLKDEDQPVDDDLFVADAATDVEKQQRRDEVEQRKTMRLSRVQRRLEMEEKIVSLKREVTDWISEQVQMRLDSSQMAGKRGSQEDLGIIGLITETWWYDSFESIAVLLDPSPRGGLILPLYDPDTFLQRLDEVARQSSTTEEEDTELVVENSNMPDICRIYQLYRECGKFVNLADWFDAFKHSIEQDGKLAIASANGSRKATNGGSKRKNSLTRKEIDKQPETNEEEDGSSSSSLSSLSDGEDDESEDDGEEEQDDDIVSATPTKKKTLANTTRARHFSADSEDEDESWDDDILDTPSRRKRARLNRDAERSISPLVAPLKRRSAAGPSETSLQARFALAINQLAKMGMLRGTRRKHEHVVKIVWDLVPE